MGLCTTIMRRRIDYQQTAFLRKVTLWASHMTTWSWIYIWMERTCIVLPQGSEALYTLLFMWTTVPSSTASLVTSITRLRKDLRRSSLNNRFFETLQLQPVFICCSPLYLIATSVTLQLDLDWIMSLCGSDASVLLPRLPCLSIAAVDCQRHVLEGAGISGHWLAVARFIGLCWWKTVKSSPCVSDNPSV